MMILCDHYDELNGCCTSPASDFWRRLRNVGKTGLPWRMDVVVDDGVTALCSRHSCALPAATQLVWARLTRYEVAKVMEV